MRFSSIVGGLSAIGGVALATTVESDNFNVTSALADLGVDVTKIPALKSFSDIQSRSTEKACSAAVSQLYLALFERC
jgi:hypothetical protein